MGRKRLVNFHIFWDLERRFESGRGFEDVLQQIDLDVAENEFLTIMGPSGAGKSTLLNILGMFDGGFEGAYEFMGQPIHGLKPQERIKLARGNIGFVFQRYHLLDDMTVQENLAIPLSYRKYKASESAALVADTLDRFRIVGKKGLYPGQLSGGQQQLVGIARAIIASPKLLLADEPTGNLHSEQSREIMQLFQRLNAEGTTIIQVTHSEENASYGRRIVRLHDGRILSDDSIAPAA